MSKRQTHMLQRRRLLLAAVAVGAAGQRAVAQAPARQDPWPSLAAQLFSDRTIRDGATIMAIDAPYRAEDAALVPVAVHSLLPNGDSRRIVSITIVIDENPSPLAAVFSPGQSRGLTSLSTRLRVDSYTNLHAVAELSDGQLCRPAIRQGCRRLLGPCRQAGGRFDPSRNDAISAIPARLRC